MMKNLVFLLLVFLARAKANFEMDVTGGFDFDAEGLTSSCASVTDCGACTKTYTCHWCSHDNSCHAKASWKGCSWGATCSAPKPQGCAVHTTCSECALSSRTCHWCAFDNACHLIGSPHGCASGVDCYSNERCRRKEPTKFERIVTEMPMGYVGFVVFLSFVLIVSLSWCLSLLGSICGGYQDVDMNEPAFAPPSISGISLTEMVAATDPSYTALETEAPEESQMEEGENNGPAQQAVDEGTADQGQSTINEGTDDPVHPIDVVGSSSDYVQMTDTGAENDNDEEPNETALLLQDPPGIIRSTTPPAGSRRIRKISRTCRMMQIVSVLLVLLLALLSVYFFPVIPTFSVCNDSIGWRRIIEHIIAMRIDASFEVLISLSNKNRIAVALDQGSGTFQFDGRPLGTFVIPPVTVESMAISDLMILAKASPDKHQAWNIVQAFRNGHLILDADFNATIRLPWLFNYTQNITVHDYQVDVTAPKDRSLCHCQTGDGSKNSTPGFLLDLIPDFDDMAFDLAHDNNDAFIDTGEVVPFES
mmetsp:Transcript_1599/g.3303  ORF Transcript_1599/g.3303 Transcript_1599/m.3303 type:complete len:534 (+) Transcript_1599:150-1751(+)